MSLKSWLGRLRGEDEAADSAIPSPPTEQEILALCRSRLAGFKTPKSVRFIDELPKNVSGKILKRELRDLYTEPND